jgi:RNA polymerase sigma factor (sigma-70 family)
MIGVSALPSPVGPNEREPAAGTDLASGVAARQSDAPAAFAELYEARYAHFVRLAYLVGDSGRGEEIVQDAFVQLLRSWDHVERPLAWLRTAVVNGCRSAGRRRAVARRHRSASQYEVVPDGSEALAVRDALRRLSPRQRAAVVLRYFDDLSEHDIAVALQCRPGTVKSLLARALPRLREVLDDGS